jgi:hypothetical protein
VDNLFIYSQPTQSTLSLQTACKNPHCHSAAGEESHTFLFKSKKEIPPTYVLGMTRKSKLIKILERFYFKPMITLCFWTKQDIILLED